MISCLFALQPCHSQESLHWSELPQLLDEHGFGGPIVGVHDEVLIVAGGANFPNGPPWSEGDQPPGSKVWHDKIFVLQPDAEGWDHAGNLPRSLAYAPAVSTDDGVYVFGGETYDRGNHPTANVILLRWDPEAGGVNAVDNALPPLPKPCHYHSADVIDHVIYVLASHAKTPSSQMLDQKSFWKLDLAKPKAERRWSSMTPWPGPAREKMAVAVQNSRAEAPGEPPRKCLFLFSGATWFKDADGKADLSRFKHFTDAYQYDPSTTKWKRIADLPALEELRDVDVNGYAYSPNRKGWIRHEDGGSGRKVDIKRIFEGVPRPAGAATAIDDGESSVLLLSGATGRFITLDIAQRPLFPREVLRYGTDTNQWSVAGKIPAGVVTTDAVKWNDRVVIPSGEIRPGVRTNKVQAFVTGRQGIRVH